MIVIEVKIPIIFVGGGGNWERQDGIFSGAGSNVSCHCRRLHGCSLVINH